MKIDDFIKYRKLIESDGFIDNEEASKIYTWMEETGRIDEGLWGTIWSWLKRNLSVTARRLHALANDYEKELTEEIKAEYNATVNKDLAAKFRKTSGMRLSRDYEDRMDLIAGDDPDYRELVRILINKKNVAVKRAMITEFAGKMDPDDVDDIKKELTIEDKKLTKKEEENYNRRFKDKDVELRPLIEELRNKVKRDSSFFSKANISTTEQITRFIQCITLYVYTLSQKDSKIVLDNKTVESIARKYVELVTNLAKKLSNSSVDEDDLKDEAKSMLNKMLKSDKPVSFERIEQDVKKDLTKYADDAAKKVEPKKEEEEKPKEVDIIVDDLDKDIVTPDSDELEDEEELKKALDKAIDDAEEGATAKEISSEIREAVKSFFTTNFDEILVDLKEKVLSFNNLDEAKRKDLARKLNYSLNKDVSLDEPTDNTLRLMLHDLQKIAGKIIPFYEIESNSSAKKACIAVAEQAFEIYAIKKTTDGKLDDNTIEDIINAIKTNL